MSVKFKYALIEISGKPILVDQKRFDEAKQELRVALEKIDGLLERIEAAESKAFALQTPDGMNPMELGNVTEFTDWASRKMDLQLDLAGEIAHLPEPFNTVATTLINTQLVLYSAALFYTGPKGSENKKNLYGELVIGFKTHLGGGSFPLELKEIVISVNNFPEPAADN